MDSRFGLRRVRSGRDSPISEIPNFRDGPMIPLRLDLRNFLCYREDVPTLDFSGIHLACLCGPNGHGKSALLDAITWCLWGTARASSQDVLVSFGAAE